MDISLEKIDTVVARTGASFSNAKKALEETEGDVIEAIILLEEKEDSWTEDISHKSEDLIDKVKDLVREGNVTKVVVKKDGRTILNIPVTFAAVGSVLAIKPALLGLGIAVLSRCSIEVVREDGEVVDVNSLLEKNPREDEDRKDNLEDDI